VSGAIIGMVGTTMSNYLKMKELRGLVQESSTGSPAIHSMLSEVSDTVQSQQLQLAGFLADFKGMLGQEQDPKQEKFLPATQPIEKLENRTTEIMTTLKQQGDQLATDISDIKTLITTQKLVFEGSEDGHKPTVVYIGKDVEEVLKDAQYHLEWKMKMNSLATVAMVYAALAVTIPLLGKIFGGGSA